jgi:hypothetical protein
MTKLIVGDRQSGRTTDLIKAAADDEAHGLVCYIVCHSQEEAYRISQLAQQMELNIGFPLTYDEFLPRQYAGSNIDKFYIDNLRMFLAYMCPIPIEMVVW